MVLQFNQRLFQGGFLELLLVHQDQMEMWNILMQVAQGNFEKRKKNLLKQNRKIMAYFPRQTITAIPEENQEEESTKTPEENMQQDVQDNTIQALNAPT